MDFISGLPYTSLSFDGIWFIMDQLTKSELFIPI